MDHTPSPIEFFRWLEEELEPGESLLIAKQVPLLDDEGNFQYYSNGMMKAVWPARRVEKRAKKLPAGPYYINIGAYDIARMDAAGRDSATYYNVSSVMFLMLDDIGTKIPRENLKLPPTWMIESSPGNFQACYKLSDYLTAEQFIPLVRGFARCGYTDPGSTNAVRWSRLPGSINIKPGKDNFVSRLAEWAPERKYSYQELLDGFGVELLPEDYHGAKGAPGAPILLKDDGNDVVLHWLSERGYVLADQNGDGWYGVTCPNCDAHTDGNPEGRYHPVNRAYKCFHGHCTDWDSRKFLDWVAEAGGPDADPGVRQELFAQALAPAIEKLEALRRQIEGRPPKAEAPPTGAAPAPQQLGPNDPVPVLFPEGADGDADVAAERLREANARREAAMLDRDAWHSTFAYVQADDTYFDVHGRYKIARRAFNAQYAGTGCRSRHGNGRQVTASTWFDEVRNDRGGILVRNVAYTPGAADIYEEKGYRYANLWRDHRPDGVAGSCSPWLDLLELMVPTQWEREWLLDWMAFKVQNPGVKINHQLVWGSKPGKGKDTAIEGFLYSVSGVSHSLGRPNVGIVSLKRMTGAFTDHLLNEVIVINEVRESSSHGKREVENDLKEFAAAPPLTLTVNRKFEAPFEVLNQCSLVLMTNYKDGLTLPHDDRRYFCLWSENEMTEEYGRKLWNWYLAGGLEHVAHYLRHRKIRAEFTPKGNAPMTEAKRVMCDESLTDAEAFIAEMVQNRRGPFACGVAATPFTGAIDALIARAPSTVVKGIHSRAIQHALDTCGWQDKGRVGGRRDGHPLSPKRIFIDKTDAALRGTTNTELRLLVDRIEKGELADGTRIGAQLSAVKSS